MQTVSIKFKSLSMEKYSWLLLALISTFALAFISKFFKTPQKLPPGPKPWPIIGNLNLIGSIPHQSLHHLSQKYGDLMLLKFGNFPVVVASSPEMAEQFLKVHDAVFASRPELAVGKYISFDYSDVAFAPYGPYLREARKIYMLQALSSKKLESWERIRAEERRSFLSRLATPSERPVVLRDELLRYNVATICRFLFGDGYCEEEKSVARMDELLEMVKEWLFLSGAFNLGDWIPWLNYLDLQGYVTRMKSLRKKMDRFFDFLIDDRLARRGAGEGFSSKKDFLDVLLEIGEDGSAQVELKRDRVKALITNLLVGGTDSSASAVEWALHELLKQPRIIEKAKAELNSVIGRNRWVEEDDFTHLSYIDAIVTETLRLRPVATLLAPRYSMEDCNVAGYDIRKGTTVIVNPWSIHRDPNSWDSPLEFLPERFAGREVDVSGNDFTLLPFGSGRRSCLGNHLGLKIVRTTLANLLHGFEVKLEEGMRAQDISMEEEYGLTTHPKHSLSLILKPTLPPHLY